MTNPGLGRTILTYLIVGPPAGATAFVIFMSAYDAFVRNNPPPLANVLMSIPLILAFAHILGALPAIITGLVMAILMKRGRRPPALFFAAVPAGATSTWLALSWLIVGPATGIPKWVAITAFGLTGAVAALASAFALEVLPRGSGRAS